MAVITTQPGSSNLIVGNKPSVLDAVILVGRDDAPLLNAFGKGRKVANVTHSWITDKIPSPVHTPGFLEISGAPAAPASTKQKTTNEVEIYKTTYSLSYDQLATENYGPKEQAHQRKLAMINHAQKTEFRILGLGRDPNAKISVLLPPTKRSDTQEGLMAGLFYYVALNETSFTPVGSYGWRGHIMAVDSAQNWSGTPTPLTISMLDELVGKPFDVGASVKRIYVGRDMKRRITELFPRQIQHPSKAMNTDVLSIDLSCGSVQVHLHHMLSTKYGLDDVIIACDPAFASFRPLAEKIKALPENESAEKQELYTSGTLEVRNATAFSILVGAE